MKNFYRAMGIGVLSLHAMLYGCEKEVVIDAPDVAQKEKLDDKAQSEQWKPVVTRIERLTNNECGPRCYGSEKSFSGIVDGWASFAYKTHETYSLLVKTDAGQKILMVDVETDLEKKRVHDIALRGTKIEYVIEREDPINNTADVLVDKIVISVNEKK